MSQTIRLETPADYRKAEELTRLAFWNLDKPGAEEHYLLNTMRRHPDYLPELCFVLEQNGLLAGCIYYTRAAVALTAGGKLPLISFGPVCISPQKQGQGLGRALIVHSIEAARKQGHRAILIGGDPNHYSHYGFEGSKKHGIQMPDGKFYTGIQALQLQPGALDDAAGTALFSEAMYPDMGGLEDFEKIFPPLEKRVQKSQAEFLKTSSELDTRSFAQWPGST